MIRHMCDLDCAFPNCVGIHLDYLLDLSFIMSMDFVRHLRAHHHAR